MSVELLLRGLIGGMVVSAFALLGDLVKPKSFAGILGAAPSVALVTLFVTIRSEGVAYAALEARSMMAGAIAFGFYGCMVCRLLARSRRSVVQVASSVLLVWLGVAFVLCSGVLMKIGLSLSSMGETHWHEYIVRFVFGALITIATGIIASRYGPVVGGLFLAFPTILPASLTLVAKHQRQRKAKYGLNGAVRGQLAAALDALGASLGSVGLFMFGMVVWRFVAHYRSSVILGLATITWFIAGFILWRFRTRRLWRAR